MTEVENFSEPVSEKVKALIVDASKYCKNIDSVTEAALTKLRDEEMTVKSLAEICQLASTDVIESFRKTCSRADIKLVAVGESEYPRSPLRQFAWQIVEEASKAGFTHLALEWQKSDQHLLDEFITDGDLLKLQQVAKHYDRFFDFGPDGEFRPDPHYFKILDTARINGFKFVAIDEPMSHQNPYQGRDAHMADVLESEFADGGKRILLFGGSKHHYRRPSLRGSHLGALELLLERSMNSTEIFSILGLVSRDINNSFRSLAKCGEHLTEKRWVDPSNSRISGVIACVEGRCPTGTCSRVNTASGEYEVCLQGRRFPNVCPNDGMYAVPYNAWNAVLILPEVDPVPWN